ncbi:MAG: dockerin type I domain-containing protein [Verrucomicrobiales bacterium]
MTNIRILTLTAFAGLAISLAPLNAQNLGVNPGDLLLGFLQLNSEGTGVEANTVIFNLGSGSYWREDTSTTSLIGNINSDLENAFGAAWFDNPRVRFGIVGAVGATDPLRDGDPPRTTYFSLGAPTFASDTTTLSVLSSSQRGSLSTKLSTLNGSSAGRPTGTNPNAAVIGTSETNNFASFVPPLQTTYFGIGTSPLSSFAAGSIGSASGYEVEGALDVYRVLHSTSAADLTASRSADDAEIGKGQFVGMFTIDAEGNVRLDSPPQRERLLEINPGDLLMGFYQLNDQGTGVEGNTVIVNLGPASAWRENSEMTSLIGNISADLDTAFGAGWYDNPNIRFGIVGVVGATDPLTEGDPARTTYYSQSATTFAPGTTAPIVLSSSQRGSLSTKLSTLSDASNGMPAGTNPAAAIISASEAGNFASLLPPLQTTYFGIGTSPLSSFGTGNLGSAQGYEVEGALDLYRVLHSTTGADLTSARSSGDAVVGTGQLVGMFTIDAAGNVRLDTAPEPVRNIEIAKGDLLMGFYQLNNEGTGVEANTVVVNLGAASAWRESTGMTSLISNVGADLENAFGANWFEDPNIRFGIVGVVAATDPVIDGDPARTSYYSQGASSFTSGTTTPVVLSSSQRGSLSTRLSTFRDSSNGKPAGLNDAASVVGTSEAGNFASLLPPAQTTYFGIGTSPLSAFGTGNIGSGNGYDVEGALDLYRILHSTTDADLTAGRSAGDAIVGTGQFIGMFTIDSAGNVRLDTAPAPLPIPGDLNGDGAVNATDIDGFILALTDPASYTATTGMPPEATGDLNDDGVFNALDIEPFITLLTDGNPTQELAEQLAPLIAILDAFNRRTFSIVDFTRNSSEIEITWLSEIGKSYMIDQSPTNLPDSWQPANAEAIVASGGTTKFVDSDQSRVSSTMWFYRIRELP